MTRLQKNDRVRLTARYVAALPYRRRRVPTDWAARRGSVVSANNTRVMVLWDGRRVSESYSPLVLEVLRG